MFDVSDTERSLGGSRATPWPSGVITAVVSAFGFAVGVPTLLAVEVGANVSLVCFGPIELVSLSSQSLVCLVFIPLQGETSLPFVLVGFLFTFAARLVIVALVASVRYGA